MVAFATEPDVTAAATKAVVARAVELFPADCVTAVVPVGNVGVPVNTGDSNGAYVDATSKEVASGDIAVCTKAVVAILVELSPEDCVVAIVVEGKVGVPVKVGDSNGAFKESPGTVGELAVPPRSPAN